jgi:hypothetical protein
MRVIQKLRYKTGWKGREITPVKVATQSCLAHSYFHLFLHFKKHLAGQKFHEDEEVKNEDITRLRAQEAECYDNGIQNLIPRVNKCLDKDGDG